LKRLVLFALLILTVAFSSYSGLLPSLKVNAAAPQAVFDPLLQQQQLQHPPETQLPAITSLPRSPSPESNTASSIPQPLQRTIITSAIDGGNSPVQNGRTTTSNSITFTFAAGSATNNNPVLVAPGLSIRSTTTSTGIADFQCTLDNSSPTPCSSPVTIHNLVAGNHIFQVRAVGTAGNTDSTEGSFSWIVVVGTGSTRSNGLAIPALQPLINSPVTTPRAVPPNAAVSVPQLLQRTTIITSAVDGNNLLVQNGGTSTSNSITFIFSFVGGGGTTNNPSVVAPGLTSGGTTTTTGIAGYQCTLDNSPTTASTCTSPASIHNLAAGNHIFQVRAVDIAGNREPIGASFSWTILASSSPSSPSSQPTGITPPSSSTTAIPSSGGGSTKANLSPPTINNNVTTAKATTSPHVILPSTATVRSSSTGGTNATTAPNVTTAKTTTTATAPKSNLTSKTGSKVLGGWSGFGGLGGCVIGNPATGFIPPNPENFVSASEKVFVVGCNHALIYDVQGASGLWPLSGFTSLGGYVISNPVVAGRSEGSTVFVVGSNHALFYNRENSPGVWSGFIGLGGNIIGDPAVGFPQASGLLDELFVVEGDHALYVSTQSPSSGAWSGFSRIGGYVISNPVLGANSDGRLQIFVVGSDHALYTSVETAPGSGSYSGFAGLGGYIIGNPAAAYNANHGLLDVFVIGSDHTIYVNRQASATGLGTWNGFERIGGVSVISDPVVTADGFGQFNDGSGQINLFVIGSDHAVYHLTQVGANSDSWAFEGLGGYVIGNPAAGRIILTSGTQVFELFVVGSDKAVYYNRNPTFF
jgi:hypothetical protein